MENYEENLNLDFNQLRELEQYKTARWLAITVIAALLILVLAVLGSLTIIVSAFLFSLHL